MRQHGGNRWTARVILMAAVVVLAGLAGCAGKIPATRYYTLEPTLPAAASAATPLPLELAVARFTATRPLLQDRLVYRPAPNEVGFYEYHRWVDSPTDLVTLRVIEHLQKAGVFRSVTPLTSRTTAPFFLSGRIESFEEVNKADAVSSRVVLDVELRQATSGSVVWSARASNEQAVEARSVDGVVRALNDALGRANEQIVKGLVGYFQQHPPEKQ